MVPRIHFSACRILAFVSFTVMTSLALLCVPAQAEVDRVINWSKCKQPDLSSAEHQKAVAAYVKKYLELAQKDRPGKHIAVQLNRVYVEKIIPDRRALVDKSYIPVGPKRSEADCPMSQMNYESLLAIRDASYQIMCRGEVAAGKTQTERLSLDAKALAYSAAYDLLKDLGWDPQAKKGEPTTPSGGRTACSVGRGLGEKDPFPKQNDLTEFKSHMSLDKVGALKFDHD